MSASPPIYRPCDARPGSPPLPGSAGPTDLLDETDDPDFPVDGPLLIITDTECDRLIVRGARPHAYLVPAGRRLPFSPKGPVFQVR